MCRNYSYKINIHARIGDQYTPNTMINYRPGYKYQLAEDYTCTLPPEFTGYDGKTQFLLLLGGVLTIRKGYAWDGPSGPTIDTKSFMRASLVHDALYQLIREGMVPRQMRDFADLELKKICLSDGMSNIRAWWVYQGVKRFGEKAVIKNKDIKVAP